MKRVIVIGSPAAGKSIFSRQLRDKTGLSLYYLDMIWHLPDRTNITKDEFDERLGEILRTDSWIIDGNYGRTIEMRLKHCDTVFLLDYPLDVIDNISVVKLDENTDAADMGYCMSRAFWGQGLMPEALEAVMDYLFDVVGLNRIAAYHDVKNPKSGRVMEKAGMRQEGILRAARKNNLGICDEVWYAMIRGDRAELPELRIDLQDTQWPFEYTDHDRKIARAICFDDDGVFYFVKAECDDDFGMATLIETSGGGVEEGEDLQAAAKRELKEELGVEVEVLCKIGVVSDYYNLIHRHNLNNYFLCKVVSFGDKNLTQDEIESFHLSTLKLSYGDAVREYEKRRETKLGQLIANRELPVLLRAREIMNKERVEQ